jgi:type VI secretion system secreted protein Hcp
MSGLVGYLKLDGEIHQNIKGGCQEEKHKDWIEVLQFEHEMEVPHNQSDTTLHGDTRQRPLKIYKQWDKASPLLFEALSKGEHFKNVTIEWYRKPGNKPDAELFFTHTLSRAKIVNIRMLMSHRDDNSNSAMPQHMEEVSFICEAAEWLWKPDNVTGKFSTRK